MNTLGFWILVLMRWVFVLLLIAAFIGLLLAVSFMVWKSVRQMFAWPLWLEAVREYRKTHPERFKYFDALKIKEEDDK